jgi:tetratricopeptide (TPR) repeat protein
MSFFKKILGKKSTPPAGDTAATPPPAKNAPAPASPSAAFEPETPVKPQPAGQPPEENLMPMLDEQGQQVMVPRPVWRERVLLPHLAEVREQPDALADTILQSLQNGFLPDMVEPAEHLAQIDPIAERGAVILSIVYRELERYDAAEAVLRQHIEKHGESVTVVFNVGLAQIARGEQEPAERTFWHALELDSNHRDALGAYLASRHKQGGDEAVQEALERIGALPGNWRARMLHARAALERKDVEAALALYREAIGVAGKPVPTDLLMQMTGDLGTTGHPDVLLKEAAPLYDVAAHGMQGAHNLFHACLQTGELPAARALLDLLFSKQQMAWRQPLGQWESEFVQARQAQQAAKAKPGEGKVTLLVDEGPIWLPERSPASELFTVPVGDVPSIAILGCSADTPTGEGSGSALRPTDAAGRFSRALPLFLAEQIRFGMQARVRTLSPWMLGEMPAFVVGRQEWTAEEAARHARSVKPECGYTIVTHIVAQAEPWQVEARLVRASDAAVLGTAQAELKITEPEAALRALAAELIGLLQREAKIEPATAPADYVVPSGSEFGLYLLCLEQLHVVRCHALPGVPAGILAGERDFLDATFHLCIAQPENICARLILTELLRLLRPSRPQVVLEYRERIQLLQTKKPLAGSAQAVLQGIFDTLFAGFPEPKK